jgi:hypothetical protein
VEKPHIHVKAAAGRQWRGALFAAVLLALSPSRGLAAEPTEQEQRVILDLYYMASAGVGQCCEGHASGCSRYENATSGLLEWCAKGEQNACKFVEALHTSFLLCQMQ